MQLALIGPHPLARDERGEQRVRIGTLFPGHAVLYTQPPGVHAMQRLNFIEHLNAGHVAAGLPVLTPEQEETVAVNSVDLIFEPDFILIRPDPERMDLACAADELLQTLVSKRKIKFLSVSDSRVLEAIKHRGECWRLSSIPKTQQGKQELVRHSRVSIRGLPIYYYNRLTGTRWLTFQEFAGLGGLDDTALARHLQEIADHAVLCNRADRPELAFFAADLGRFGAADFSGARFEQLPSAPLRERFRELVERFRAAVHEAYRTDGCQSRAWCERMISTLFLEGSERDTERVLSGLSAEFFLQIEWLPGGRYEGGEFLFDSLFDEAEAHPGDKALRRLCDPVTRGIIFNLIREHGDLDYVNVGCLPESLSLNRPQKGGRRGVYIVEFQSRYEPEPERRFLRLQKWDVWEHLDEGHDLLRAIRESEEYTDYWLDRRLGCRQLGMNLTRRVVMRRLTIIYRGANPRYQGERIRSTYFEREFLKGVATDKIPLERYDLPGYALKLAVLLGRAAASSLIVGRALGPGARAVFDDGDELLREDENNLPAEILIGDHSGAFGEYQLPMETFAADYARPVNERDKLVPHPVEFATAYLAALREQLLHIQNDYRERPRAFDTLFKGCRYDPAGSFAYRWECVLRRLKETDVNQVVAAIRRNIRVLNPASATPVVAARPEPARVAVS
jgi:hypothetical protein